MPRHWVKFNVFFETLEDDDSDALFDDIVDAVAGVIDPSCAALDWEALDGTPPDGHQCTRDWTAGACSIPALPEDTPDMEIDLHLDAIDEGLCPSCGRPFPDAGHRFEAYVKGQTK